MALLADIVRGKNAMAAITALKFMPQKGARILEKVIKAAVANAKANHQVKDENNLILDQVFVNKGIVMKRFRAAARGRAAPRLKRTSHVTVWVKEETNGTKN